MAGILSLFLSGFLMPRPPAQPEDFFLNNPGVVCYFTSKKCSVVPHYLWYWFPNIL